MRGSRLARIAPLPIFAILLQAILFGWHHHQPVVSGRLPVPIIENPSGPPQVVDDEDGCEICQVLHHLTAAPVDTIAAPSPLAVASDDSAGDAAFVARTPVPAFRARAPPRA